MMIRALLTTTLLLITLYGCSDSDTDNKDTLTISTDGYTSFNSASLEDDLHSYEKGSLSQPEREGLLFLYEEEKLVSDLYASFNDEWTQAIFESTSVSEASHSDAVGVLIERYSVSNPGKEQATGEFSNQELQSLYSELYSEGSASLVDALAASAAAEELSLIDVQVQLGRIDDNDDIIFVYEQLLLASRNHLRVFVKNIEYLDTSYAPRYLTVAEYDAIMAIDIEILVGE